jgi:hypothetical protein
MPPLTRWFVRSALAWLLLALAGGILLASGVAARIPGTDMVLPYPTYLHLVTVGSGSSRGTAPSSRGAATRWAG